MPRRRLAEHGERHEAGAKDLHEPYEGSPETVVVMAIGVRARVYRDATAYAVQRMREQAQARRHRP